MNWIKRIGGARLMALAILSLWMGSAAIETSQARVGRSRGGISRSFGNRGSRSPGIGLPSGRMQPLPRIPTRARNNGVQRNRPATANRGSWFGRNPLMSGLIGAIAGTVIGSMLMNALGGAAGLGNFLVLILGAIALFVIFRLFKRSQQPALATNVATGNKRNYSAPTVQSPSDFPYSSGASTNANSNVNSQTREQGLAAIALEDASMTQEQIQNALSSRFFAIQEAWSSADRAALSAATTQSMFDELNRDLTDMERRQERNIIKNIAIRTFEITEAWQENDADFVTAHIEARLLDYTQRGAQIIDGDATNPTHFGEYWTFVRPRGHGEWKLSAINQKA